MSGDPKADPILTRFHAALGEMYGDRRKEPGTLRAEIRRLASLTTDILIDTGAVISATPFRAGAYRERTGFMHEVRQDGVDL